MGLICTFGFTPVVFETRQLNKVEIVILLRKLSFVTNDKSLVSRLEILKHCSMARA